MKAEEPQRLEIQVSKKTDEPHKVTLRSNLKNQPIEEESLMETFKDSKFGEKISYGTIRKKKIDKSKIGRPESFRVVQHVSVENNQFHVLSLCAYLLSI